MRRLLWCLCLVVLWCDWCWGQGRSLHVSDQYLPDFKPTEQFRSISEVAAIVRPGDTVVIHGGVYRETVRVRNSGRPEAPIRFEAAPFAQVVLTGADRVSGWQRSSTHSDVFIAALPQAGVQLAAVVDDLLAPDLITERVLVNGNELRPAPGADSLSPGTYHVDEQRRKLLVCVRGIDPTDSDAVVERIARPVLWEIDAQYVHLRGLRFRDNTHQPESAGLIVRGSHAVIEDCVFESCSIGVRFRGASAIARRCRFEANGVFGIHAQEAHDLRLSQVTIARNGSAATAEGIGGGARISHSRGVMMDSCRVEDNDGPGVIFASGSEAGVVQQSLVRGNVRAGLVLDACAQMRLTGNVILGNGLSAIAAQPEDKAGVVIAGSTACLVERNLVLGNRQGVAYVERQRQIRRIGSNDQAWRWVSDITIAFNTIAYNRDVQLAGWFDMPDDRHLPARDAAPPKEFALTDRGPVGLSLHKLNLSHRSNVYALSPAQGFATWGATTRRQRQYPSVGAFRAELELEDGSVQTELLFAAPHQLDLRLPKGSVAMLLKAYPDREVPGVMLGIDER